jgi:hypothetical protein
MAYQSTRRGQRIRFYVLLAKPVFFQRIAHS